MPNMVKRSSFLFLIFFVTLMTIFSCQKTFKSKEEYSDYINDVDNGFSQIKEVNGVKIIVTFKPSDLLVCQEVENKNFSKEKTDSIRLKYNNLLYFILSYSKDDKEILSTIESRSQFNEIQNKLTFKMNENVSLVNNFKDTIPLQDYNFTRTYGMSKTSTLLFVFRKNDKIENSNQLNFILSDIGIGIGNLEFKFDTNILEKTAYNY